MVELTLQIKRTWRFPKLMGKFVRSGQSEYLLLSLALMKNGLLLFSNRPFRATVRRPPRFSLQIPRFAQIFIRRILPFAIKHEIDLGNY